jgi:hypothetical protein
VNDGTATNGKEGARPRGDPPRRGQPAAARGMSWIDRSILLACLAATTALLVVLARFPGPRRVREGVGIVGVATLAIYDVRQRFADSMVWETLDTGGPVYAGDSVFVAPSAAAVLQFNDGGKMDLDAGTLITIAGSDPADPRGVELRRGGMTITAESRSLRVRTQSGSAELQSGGVGRIRVDDPHGAQITMSSGVALLAIGARRHTVAQDQTARLVGDDRITDVRTLPVRLQAPAHDERYFFRDSASPLALRWSAAGESRLFLQIAELPGFNPPLMSTPAKNGDTTWTPPRPGTYWWRLIDGWGEAQSETRKFSVLKDVPPTPVTPRDGTLVVTAEGPVLLEWTAVAGATVYQVELAAERTMAAPLLRQRVEGRRVFINDPPREGTYFWRVRALAEERGESPWSMVAEFRCVAAAVLHPPTGLHSEQQETPGGGHGN